MLADFGVFVGFAIEKENIKKNKKTKRDRKIIRLCLILCFLVVHLVELIVNLICSFPGRAVAVRSRTFNNWNV